MKRTCTTYHLHNNVARHGLMSGRQCVIREISNKKEFAISFLKVDEAIESCDYGECVRVDYNHLLYVFRNQHQNAICVIELFDIVSDFKKSFVYSYDAASQGPLLPNRLRWKDDHYAITEGCYNLKDFLLYQHYLPNRVPSKHHANQLWDTRVSRYESLFKAYCKLWGTPLPHPIELLPFTDVGLCWTSSIFRELDAWEQGYDTVWNIFLKDEYSPIRIM